MNYQFPISGNEIDRTFNEIVRCIRDLVKGKPLEYRGIDCAEPLIHMYSTRLENDSPESDHCDEPLYRLVRIAFSLGICQGYAMHRRDIGHRLDKIAMLAKIIAAMEGMDSDAVESANAIVCVAESISGEQK